MVLKRRIAVDATSSFGLEASDLVPTARKGLASGSGKPDYAVNGIYSGDFGLWHSDVNLVDTRLGGVDPGSSRHQLLGAVALSHPVLQRWTVAGELSGIRQHGTASSAQGLAALSYAIRRDIVVDIGAAHALNRATPTWQAFSGITIVIGRID